MKDLEVYKCDKHLVKIKIRMGRFSSSSFICVDVDDVTLGRVPGLKCLSVPVPRLGKVICNNQVNITPSQSNGLLYSLRRNCLWYGSQFLRISIYDHQATDKDLRL